MIWPPSGTHAECALRLLRGSGGDRLIEHDEFCLLDSQGVVDNNYEEL